MLRWTSGIEKSNRTQTLRADKVDNQIDSPFGPVVQTEECSVITLIKYIEIIVLLSSKFPILE